MEENRILIEEFFGKHLSEYLQKNPGKVQELYLKLKLISQSDEWQIFRKIIEDTRERVIEGLQTADLKYETLIAYKETITALDFLKNLPENLIRILESEINLTNE